MARRLPWLSESSKKQRITAESTPAKRKRVGNSETPQDEQTTPDVISPKVVFANSHSRSTYTGRGLSSSPTAAPPISPPPQELMHDGLDKDDQWMMVEDEFQTTASYFTRHLHHAEYQRLKRLVKSRNDSSNVHIARPVDNITSLSGESSRKIEGRRRRAKGKVALANIGAESEEEEESEDPWLTDPRLAGLMSTKENSAQLGRIVGLESKTRASQGYLQQQSPRHVKDRSHAPAKMPDNGSGTKRSTISRPRVPGNYNLTNKEDVDDDTGRICTRSLSHSKEPSVQHKPTISVERLSNLRSEVQAMGNKIHLPPALATTAVVTSQDGFDDFETLPVRRNRIKAKNGISGSSTHGININIVKEERRRSLKLEEIPTFLV